VQYPVDSARQGGVLFGRDLAREQASGRRNWPLIVLDFSLRASSRFSPGRYSAPIHGPISFFCWGQTVGLAAFSVCIGLFPASCLGSSKNSETLPGW